MGSPKTTSVARRTTVSSELRADLLLKSDPPRPNAAVQDCTAALKMNPDSAKSLRIRGTAYRRLGKYEEAAADLRRAMQQDFQPALKEMFDSR